MSNFKDVKSLLLSTLIAMTAPMYTPVIADSHCDYKTINIVTGEVNTTYNTMGNEIQSLLVAKGLPAVVHSTNGSLENIGRIHNDCRAQIGITQSDTLSFLRGSGDPALIRVASDLRYLFPLHNEEVHILAKKEIKTIADLEGKIVSIGALNSGTAMTANVILNQTGITVSKKVRYSGKRALEALKGGEIDAMFYVIGYPYSLLENNVEKGDKLHLLPITDSRILDIYTPTEIPADGYGFMSGPVKTVVVRSILFTWNYKKAYCPRVAKAAELIRSEIAYLRKNGHAKWNDAEIDKKLQGWDQFECTTDRVATNQDSNPMDNILAEIRKAVLVE